MGREAFSGLMLSALLMTPVAAQAAETAKDKPALIWGYQSGDTDNEGWAELSKDFEVCRYGDRQSPMILAESKRSAMAPLEVHYGNSKVRLEKKDRTMVMDVTGNNTLTDHGKTYKLVHMRIHTPAEHQLLNALNPMELHLIHKDAEGHILIMAIWGTRTDEAHPGLQALIDKMPDHTHTIVNMTFNPATLLPEKDGYYAYTGSLTWPPCTEGVEWRVRKYPIGISRSQMKALGKLFGRNARLSKAPYMRVLRETIY